MKKTLAILLAAVLTISMALTAILFVASADDEIVLDPKNSENLSIGSVAEGYVTDLVGATPLSTAQQLIEAFSVSTYNGYITGNYYLTNDITLPGDYWPSYGNFNGKLDGCGYTITTNEAPLWWWIWGNGVDVVVKNLTVHTSGYVSGFSEYNTGEGLPAGGSIKRYVGILAQGAGKESNASVTIDNVLITGKGVEGSVTGGYGTGGLLGEFEAGGTISDVYVNIETIESGNNVGGVVGCVYGGSYSFDNVHVNAAINANIGYRDGNGVGGFIGRIPAVNATIENSTVNGTVENAGIATGGFIGCITNSGQVSGSEFVIKDCETNADIENLRSQASSERRYYGTGGFVGNITASTGNLIIDDCVNSGNIVANVNSGGFVGNGQGGMIVELESCVNNGAVTVTGSAVSAGGFVGKAYQASFLFSDEAGTNCVNNGNITAESFAGGFCGNIDHKDSWMQFYNLRNYGAVTAWNAGGILGFSDKDNLNNEFIDCVNNAVVTGGRVGGIVGSIKRIKEMTNCTNNNNIVVMADSDPASEVGGIIGRVQEGGEVVADSISNLTNNGDIIAQAGAVGAEYVGGIVGSFEIVANISNCDNNGDITLGDVVGGIVGYTIVGTSVDADSVNTGSFPGQQTGNAIGYIYDFDTDTTVPNGQSANIKVMTYNLQSSYRTDERIANVLTVLAENPADVYCFQEADTWLQDLDDLGSQYTIAPGTNSLASDCPIYYNTSTLRHKDSRFYFLMDKGEVVDGVACKHPTYFAYAVFEHKVTGKQFLVINAHLDYGSSSGVRTEQARMILEDRLESDQNLSQYNDLPIIFVGDMNADYQTGYEGNGQYHYDTESTITYLNTQVGLKWAYQMNGVQFIADGIPSFHWFSGEPYTLINNAFRAEFPNDGTAEDFAEENGWSMDKRILDFIFVSNDGSITPMEYEVIYRNFATTEGHWKYASDHMPVTCEMTIN
ncbi:MAG: endonuclease/exonuclease/phosphatase family protein [Clostridia bacterium]|nr:endonuclease/exonuclease/phosphatase family protein [Clostridia bacterium]